MSIESAKAFLERVKDDEDFRKELEEQASAEERIKFAKAQGFDFTKEEIDSLKDELSDDQMDAVAGGFITEQSIEIGERKDGTIFDE